MTTDFLDSWYIKGTAVYSRRTDLTKFGHFFVSLEDGIGLSTAESCISIGPGDGEADTSLLKNSFARLKKYTAVDASAQQLVTCKKQLESLGRSDVTMEFVNSRIEQWEGPKEPVDLVMMVQCIYYIKDQLNTIKRCWEWLKPGGTLCIVVDGDESLFYRAAMKYGIRDQIYRAKDVRKDMKTIGIEYQEVKWIKELDMRDRDRDLMNFFGQKKLNQAEFDDLDKFLHEVMPTGIMNTDTYINWSKRPATN